MNFRRWKNLAPFICMVSEWVSGIYTAECMNHIQPFSIWFQFMCSWKCTYITLSNMQRCSCLFQLKIRRHQRRRGKARRGAGHLQRRWGQVFGHLVFSIHNLPGPLFEVIHTRNDGVSWTWKTEKIRTLFRCFHYIFPSLCLGKCHDFAPSLYTVRKNSAVSLSGKDGHHAVIEDAAHATDPHFLHVPPRTEEFTRCFTWKPSGVLVFW